MTLILKTLTRLFDFIILKSICLNIYKKSICYLLDHFSSASISCYREMSSDWFLIEAINLLSSVNNSTRSSTTAGVSLMQITNIVDPGNYLK